MADYLLDWEARGQAWGTFWIWNVSALEREIDELVYALYGLTPEENQNRGRRSQIDLSCLPLRRLISACLIPWRSGNLAPFLVLTNNPESSYDA